MAAVKQQIPELDAQGLRDFAFVTSAVVAGLFGLFFPWILDAAWPRWPWALAAILSIWGLIAPLTLRAVYTTWMRFGLLLSKVTTPIIMGVVFFLVITPIGLVRRLTSEDSMQRAYDDERESYRIPSDKPSPDKLERPF